MTADERVVDARDIYRSCAEWLSQMDGAQDGWGSYWLDEAARQCDAASIDLDLANAAASDARAVRGVAW